MDTRDILLFIATVVNIGFASAILFKNPKNPINIAYGVTVAATALWTLGLAMFRLSAFEAGLNWARFYYIAAGLIAAYFLYFGIYFPNNAGYRIGVFRHILFHTPILIIVWLVFSPSFIAGYRLQDWGKEIVLGPAYLFYAAFWVVYMAAAFFLMLNRLPSAAPMEKLQLKFVLAGTLVAAVGGSFFNLFLPLAGNYRYIWAGPYPTLVMVVTIGYAIFKHRILNIRIISTEIFSVTLLTIFLTQFFRSETASEFMLQGAVVGTSAVLFILLIRAINREVTLREEMARLAAQLVAANEELKKLDAAKSEFISIASHQLRAPLTVIKGYVSMLLEGTLGPASELVKESMKKVFISSEQLIRLIADMLDLSRIEAGRMKYDFKRVMMDDIVAEVVRELEPIAGAKGLAFSFDSRNAARLRVKADPDKIREAVMNLIDNAVKYTAAGRVSAELYPEQKDGRQWLTLKVRDTGIGIRSSDIGRMFTKFARTEEARRLRADGLGLGLYVVKKIIEDHGGRVSAESPGLGYGSTFIARLPVAQ